MNSWVVHYKNKYPGGLVLYTALALNVYNNKGAHCVCVEKDGNGDWHDRSEQYGLKDRHCLAPIPKNARVHKLYAGGGIGPSEEAKERIEHARSMMVDGRVPSIAEFKALGAGFDEKNNLLGAVKLIEPKPFDQVMQEAEAAVVPEVIDASAEAFAGEA